MSATYKLDMQLNGRHNGQVTNRVRKVFTIEVEDLDELDEALRQAEKNLHREAYRTVKPFDDSQVVIFGLSRQREAVVAA